MKFKTEKPRSSCKTLAYGAGICLLTTLLSAAVYSWMLSKQYLQETSFGHTIMAILMLSSTIGCYLGSKTQAKAKWQVCLGISMIYYLILLSITAFFFSGQYQGFLVTGAVILCGSALAFLAGKGRSTGSKLKIKL